MGAIIQDVQHEVTLIVAHLVAQVTGIKKPAITAGLALLAGHERGNTENFKTYSKNSASSVELSEYVEMVTYDLLLSN